MRAVTTRPLIVDVGPEDETAAWTSDPGPASDAQWEAASLGRRLGAYVIDFILAYALLLAISIPAITVWGQDGSYLLATLDGDTTREQLGWYAIQIGVTAFAFRAYLIVTHRVWGGQTLGKRLLGIRVAALDGSIPTREVAKERANAFTLLGVYTPSVLLPVVIVLDVRLMQGGVDSRLLTVSADALFLAAWLLVAASVLFSARRRSVIDAIADTVVVGGGPAAAPNSTQSANGDSVVDRIKPRGNGELVWFGLLLLLMAALFGWGTYTSVLAADDQEAAEANTAPGPQASVADRNATSRLARLTNAVDRCLESGKGATACSDPARYRSLGLKFTVHPGGSSMFFNPDGRYTGKVELNPEGSGVAVYAYTQRRIWGESIGGKNPGEFCGNAGPRSANDYEPCEESVTSSVRE